MAKKAATEHLEMAQEVSNWAKKYNSHNELTKNLVADLESKSNLHKWAELDPFEFLPYPGKHLLHTVPLAGLL